MCFGVVKIINRILQDHNPDYVVVASDPGGKVFRHDMYPLYKSNRSTKPCEFEEQIETVARIISAYGFPLVKVPNFEADDIIGSIAKKFAAPDLMVTIVSGDKDFMQLINKNVRLLRVTNDGDFFCDEQGVMARFGCTPAQVIDCLAIMGDSSDTVPGVKGIGEKGAAKLIQQFGSLEAIYEHLGTNAYSTPITPKMAAKLHADHEMALLSKSLVTIK
jgi:DNA polymerase-1